MWKKNAFFFQNVSFYQGSYLRYDYDYKINRNGERKTEAIKIFVHAHDIFNFIYIISKGQWPEFMFTVAICFCVTQRF